MLLTIALVVIFPAANYAHPTLTARQSVVTNSLGVTTTVENGSSKGVMVAAIVGAIVAFVAIIALGAWYGSHRRKKAEIWRKSVMISAKDARSINTRSVRMSTMGSLPGSPAKSPAGSTIAPSPARPPFRQLSGSTTSIPPTPSPLSPNVSQQQPFLPPQGSRSSNVSSAVDSPHARPSQFGRQPTFPPTTSQPAAQYHPPTHSPWSQTHPMPMQRGPPPPREGPSALAYVSAPSAPSLSTAPDGNITHAPVSMSPSQDQSHYHSLAGEESQSSESGPNSNPASSFMDHDDDDTPATSAHSKKRPDTASSRPSTGGSRKSFRGLLAAAVGGQPRTRESIQTAESSVAHGVGIAQ